MGHAQGGVTAAYCQGVSNIFVPISIDRLVDWSVREVRVEDARHYSVAGPIFSTMH